MNCNGPQREPQRTAKPCKRHNASVHLCRCGASRWTATDRNGYRNTNGDHAKRATLPLIYAVAVPRMNCNGPQRGPQHTQQPCKALKACFDLYRCGPSPPADDPALSRQPHPRQKAPMMVFTFSLPAPSDTWLTPCFRARRRNACTKSLRSAHI